MTRIRMRTGPTALFGAMLAVALIMFLPMRLALGWFGVGDEGLSSRRVTDTIWGGTLREARFGDLALGDLHAELSPFALLIGRARLGIEGTGIAGAAIASRHLVGIDHVTATLPTGRVFAPVPVTTLSLDDVSVRFRDGACEAAEGRVRATLAGDAGGIVLPQSVAGVARCEGDALLLPLASQAATESIALRITGAGRYTATLAIRPADPAAGERLAAAGFVANADGYRLSIEGSF